MNSEMSVLTSTESVEWYTPASIIALVRMALPGGRINLDPASSELANRTVQAERIFTKDDDGLRQPLWDGPNIFLNPPFGKVRNESLAGIWLEEMYRRWNLMQFREGIALTHTRCGYEWWEEMFRFVPTCLTRAKISFVPADGRKAGGSKTSQSFFYFGNDPKKFQQVFKYLGRVILPD